MLNWIEIRTEDIGDYLANDQLELLRTQHLGEGKDPLLAIIGDVCNYIRSFVPTNWRTGNQNSVPNECKLLAICLVIETLQSRLPELQLSADQVRNAQNARHALERLIEVWTKESTEQKTEKKEEKSDPSRIEAVNYRKNTVNGKTLKGL